MDFGENLTWFLSELSERASGTLPIAGQDDKGNPGECRVPINTLTLAAKARIERLEHALTQVLDLAERDTPFGAARPDVVCRAREGLQRDCK